MTRSDENFWERVEPGRARVVRLPATIFVYGGRLNSDPRADPLSYRQLFLSWTANQRHPVATLLKIPEDYPEWNQFEGYEDLIAFERDVGYLSRAILLFVESPGAIAELGAFCTNAVLAERMFVVITDRYYHESSFIKLGPLRLIERGHAEGESPVCVIESSNVPSFAAEAGDVADSVLAKSNRIPNTAIFDPNQARDQFLFIADMVELFGALTFTEITYHLRAMGINLTPNRVRQMLNLLQLLGILEFSNTLTHRYYVAPTKDRGAYIDYHSQTIERPFDRIRFKLQVADSFKGDGPRRRAYEKVHRKL